MASDYGLNIGFRRSDESVRLSEGRYRTPKDVSLLMGTAVEIDHDNPGYLKQCASNAEMRTGQAGLLLQEEGWDFSIYGKQRADSFDLGFTLRDRLSVITTGAGTKIWMRNTAGQTRVDGRIIPAVTMFNGAGLNLPGGARYLGWDGTQFVVVGGGVTNRWLEVLEYNPDRQYIEAVFLV